MKEIKYNEMMFHVFIELNPPLDSSSAIVTAASR